MKASVAACDITPAGTPDLCGFAARKGKTLGVHDRLNSKWLYLADEKTQALLSSNDLLGFSRSFYQRMSGEISRQSGVPASHVYMAAAHTHSGPATVTLRRCGSVDPAYVRSLREKMLAGAQKVTVAKASPIRVGIATGRADCSMNRRDRDNGPLDDSFSVIVLQKLRSEKPLAVLVNYACHAVVMGEGNLYVSGDYTSSLQKTVEAETGAKCLFLNGACGDINPKVAHSTDFRDAQKMGEKLAHKALSLMRKLTWIEPGELGCARQTLQLPVHVPSDQAEIDETLRQVTEVFGLPEDLFADRFAKYKQQVAEGTFPKNVEAQMSLLSFGSEVGFVFIPAEVFTEIGMQIKRMSPYRHTFVVGYANGCVGYLPTKKAYLNTSGYEPYLAPLFYGVPRFESNVEDVVLAGAEKLFARSLAGEALLV